MTGFHYGGDTRGYISLYSCYSIVLAKPDLKAPDPRSEIMDCINKSHMHTSWQDHLVHPYSSGYSHLCLALPSNVIVQTIGIIPLGIMLLDLPTIMATAKEGIIIPCSNHKTQ